MIKLDIWCTEKRSLLCKLSRSWPRLAPPYKTSLARTWVASPSSAEAARPAYVWPHCTAGDNATDSKTAPMPGDQESIGAWLRRNSLSFKAATSW